jgi:dimeric dUTPase (all-alpha-NTP-PPase superfamily)
MAAKKTKKRNPQDATLRNIRALKKQLNALEKEFNALAMRTSHFENFCCENSLDITAIKAKLSKVVRAGK